MTKLGFAHKMTRVRRAAVVRIEKVRLLATPEDVAVLRALLVFVNSASTHVATVALGQSLFSHRPLRDVVYSGLREQGCNSGHADLIPRRVAAAYADRHRREQVVTFRPLAGVPLDRRSFSYRQDGTISIWTLTGRISIPFVARAGVALSNLREATLVLDEKGRFFLHQVVEATAAEPSAPENFLGVDLGIVNIATDSDGAIHSGAAVNGLRHRHDRLRSKLQSKGTKSAKRLLRKRRRREGRFARNENHRISKELVTKARDTRRGIALEDLSGIRDWVTVRRAQRRSHHSWSFFQLRSFIEYKAKLHGVEVRLVDPRNTSRTCPSCAHVAKGNRRAQSVFRCLACDYAGHADTIAAGNISSRAVSFRPNADPARPGAATKEVAHG